MTREEVAGLVARAQRGDAEAFAALYEQHAPEIHRYLMRQVHGRRELAEDLTAEVFLKVFERIGSYQARGLPFGAWVYRVARNHTIDHLRAQRTRAADSLERAPEAAEVADRDAARDYGQVLDHLTLGPALARLSPEQRRALELRFLDGLPTAATAAIMGKTEHAVKKLQSRGLGALRRILEAGVAEETERHAVVAAIREAA